MVSMVIRYDTTVGAFYLKLSDQPVARTVHISDDVVVDLDAKGTARGIELLIGPSHLTSEERAALVALCPAADEMLAEVARLMPAAV